MPKAQSTRHPASRKDRAGPATGHIDSLHHAQSTTRFFPFFHRNSYFPVVAHLESDLATLLTEAMADCAAWETDGALGPAKAG